MKVAISPSSAAVLLRHHAEEDVAVRHREAVGVFEVELELRIAVLVVEGIDVPAQLIHRAHHPVEPVVAVEEALHVVAALLQIVVVVRHGQRAAIILPDHIDLAFDAEIEGKAHLRRLRHHLLERDAGIHLVGRALEPVVRRHPRDFRLPGQRGDRTQVGHRANFVVVRRLAETVERIAGVKLGAARKIFKVGDGHALALGDAVDIDVGAHAVFHAEIDQVLFQSGEFLVGFHAEADNMGGSPAK
ncbi:MAG: hypothetical protein QM796_21185 [Chthoniobacteraceae bacterium]